MPELGIITRISEVIQLVIIVLITVVGLGSFFIVAFRSWNFLQLRYYDEQRLSLISINPFDTDRTLRLIGAHARLTGDFITARLALVARISHILWFVVVLLSLLIQIALNGP